MSNKGDASCPKNRRQMKWSDGGQGGSGGMRGGLGGGGGDGGGQIPWMHE